MADALSGAAGGAATGASFGPYGALIGGGLGLLSSLFGGNKPQQQNQWDPDLRQYLQAVRGLGMSAYNQFQTPNIDPGFTNSMQALQNYSGQGVGAGRILMGQDQAGAQQAMNPYASAMQPVFDRMRQAAVSHAGLAATSPFGVGAREGLMTSNALTGVGNQEAQFNYQGWQDQMNRLLSVYNMGLGATGQQQAGGQWLTQLPMQWQQGRMGLLSQGLGSAGSETMIPQNRNLFESILGGATAGYGATKG